jgi:flavin-dependent dehydrogenase
MNPFDVAIAGAGIGGTCAAIALARRGHKVLLLEAGEFPRHKVCGEFLSPESKAVFKRLGVLDTLHGAGASEVHHAHVLAYGAQMRTPLPSAALALSRFQLDTILIEAAQDAGAEVLCHTRVRQVTREADSFHIETTNGQWQAREVVAASGRHAAWLPKPADSNATRYVGLKTHFRNTKLQRGTVEIHAWRGGYCGLVQIENGLTNACLLARYDNLRGRSPQQFWEWLLQNVPSLRARMRDSEAAMPWLSTGNVQFGQQAPVQDEVLCIGDAAGFIHPLAGDGMAMAARSGELAATVLNAQLRGDIDATTTRTLWAGAWQREFASRLSWAGRFQQLLIDSQMVAPLLGLMARWPRLSQFAVAKTRGTA